MTVTPLISRARASKKLDTAIHAFNKELDSLRYAGWTPHLAVVTSETGAVSIEQSRAVTECESDSDDGGE